VDGRVLPPFGFLARSANVDASIERSDEGIIVERSQGPEADYFNGRGNDPDPPLPLTPTAGKFTDLGGGRFRLAVDWAVTGPVERDLNVFLHVRKPVLSRLVHYETFANTKPPVPTTRWQGRMTTGDDDVATLPADSPAGEYDVLVGMTDPKTRNRARVALLGDERDDRRYQIGSLVVEKNGNAITSLRLQPSAAGPAPNRFNAARRAVDFIQVITPGGLRCRMSGAGAAREVVLTPLPDEPGCEVGLRLERAGLGAGATVEAVDAEGKRLREVPARSEGGVLRFETRTGEFAYRVK
jgi:hypothetical protein